MRRMGVAALLLALAAPVWAQGQTIEELDADPDNLRMDTRSLAGACQDNPFLGKMMRERDEVKKLQQVRCDLLVFTPPGETGESRNNGLAALVLQEKGQVYFKGAWSDGETLNLEFSEVSFDQETWFPVFKGRLRGYQGPDGAMFLLFAVFQNPDNKRIEGVATDFLVSEAE